MSWDAYVSDQLIGTGNVKQAAICGLDGATWATSAGFNMAPEEILKIVNGFNDHSSLAMGGLNIAGTKFMFLSGTDSVLRGKKGQVGVHIAKTVTAVIVALYEEPIQPGQCAVTVESLADYLKSVSY